MSPTSWTLRILSGACAVLFFSLRAQGADTLRTHAPMADAVHRLAARYNTFAIVPNDPQGRVVYGTAQGYLQLIQLVGSRYRRIWTSPSLVTRIHKVVIADLKGDGTYQIVAYNGRGSIFVYDLDTFALVWESQYQQFRSVEALTVGNVDNDRQQEILFLSEGRLYIYDGAYFIEEWRSAALYAARDVAVGDVDGDGEAEIVLGSGQVLDGRSRRLEWENAELFGDHLELADIDGDGKLELIAGTNEAVTIWDVDERREKWE